MLILINTVSVFSMFAAIYPTLMMKLCLMDQDHETWKLRSYLYKLLYFEGWYIYIYIYTYTYIHSNIITIQTDRCYCRVYLKRFRQDSTFFKTNIIIVQIDPCHCFIYYQCVRQDIRSFNTNIITIQAYRYYYRIYVLYEVEVKVIVGLDLIDRKRSGSILTT